MNPTMERAWISHRWHGLAIVLLMAIAAYYACTTFVALANFAWLQPMIDQYRLYELYLTLPFPANVLQLENGHRPIIPALLRVGEIGWSAADQRWQIGVGVGLVATTWLLLVGNALRQREWSPLLRACAVVFATLGVLWLANARMLMHGNELVHTYLVTTCVVAGAIAIWQARRRAAQWPTWLAAACCTIATFSFGTGIATFASASVLALVLRVPARNLWPLPLLFVASLLAYVFLLPGEAGVRNMLHFDPIASVWMALQWLGSPWVNAWLGLGEPALIPSTAEAARQTFPGTWLSASAGLLVRVLGSEGRYALAGVASTAGVIALLAAMWRRWRCAEPGTRIEAIALALCLFGAASSLVIGIARLDYLQQALDQRFADRYLVWPCLFWLGLAVLGVARLARLRRREGLAVAVAVVAGIAALPMHHACAGWSAAVYAGLQRFAAAVQSDVVDESVYPSELGVKRASVTHTLSLFRERKLAMFAQPHTQELGKVWPVSAASRPADAEIFPAEMLIDATTGQAAAHFAGWFTRGVRTVENAGPLVVLDDDGRVVGYAQISFIGPGREPLRLTLPHKRGFDGYIREYRGGARYRLAQLDDASHRAMVIAEIRPPATSD